ncbi:glycosyltransferase [Photobacterium damselae]
MKKKLLIISPYNYGGGVESVTRYEDQELQVSFSVQRIYLYNSKNKKIMNLFQLYKIIKQNNIIHSHVYNVFYMFFIWFFTRIEKVKLITTFHSSFGFNDDIFSYSLKPGYRTFTILRLLYNCLSNFFGEKIICVSNSVDISIKTIFPNINTSVIYNPCESTDFINNGNGDYSYIGRLSLEKQPQLLIKSFKKPGISEREKLNIYGDGELFSSLYLQVIHADNIKLHGWTRIDYEVWSNTKCIIMPSLYEGMSLVALDFLEKGIPLIARKIPSFLELHQLFPNLIFLFESEDELEQLILNLPSVSNDDRIKVKNIINKRFGLNNFARATETLFNEISILD